MGLKGNKQIHKNKHFIVSFLHALQGIITLIKDERNFRFHLFSSLVVIIFSFYLKINLNEWLWILLALFLVLLSETINTIVETVVDLFVGDKYNNLAKKSKDVAAGGVLIASLFSILVGLIIFLPIILQKLN
ncbi:diacylglycerol kinase family protein [Apilactobacillus timberlakei]|uniref:Diacylglycerol kinase family protein n=1 Tax=Apilactobacillus timberlakei TaxID=2008380 RepID=A0ABY2YTE3_9LACO|nr:diacylglycerol kinase family protein [Apilactobacillus timberlakei]TPR13866.1 diacylglycerol kinase family protein [Apilactobacillus timberlakei]TPR15182.1 diacylglycerol kinase family protein [Apilactobacillus timberlakei]TPR17073.1 diacylglycerol kinase family protein [Apilactobacillus timberlakei]TPR17475.1 diacylglycerol kinase family protein [Apilactobacillus timberlakei]TPR23968.1 diacylglycerol kinase family protein [Apilactobacillus timberlakei]